MTIGAFSPFDAVLDKVPRLGATLRAGTVTVTGGRLSVDIAGTVVTNVPYLGGAPPVGERIWLLRQGSTLLGFGTIGSSSGGGVTDHSALTGVTTSQHHTRYTNAEAQAAVAGLYLPLGGGTLTGFLTLHAAPTNNLHAATKAYVDTKFYPHVVDPTEPVTKVDGMLWTNPTTGVTKIWDADNSQWVTVGGVPGTYLPIAGGTMTGFITLHAAPTATFHAATKKYVDDYYGILATLFPNYLERAGGTMTGAITLPAANPTVATQAAHKGYIDQQDALRLALAGGTMSGFITLHADPSSAMHAATKQYADTKSPSTHNHDAAYAPIHGHPFLLLVGGAMGGFITLHSDPSLAMHAATKQYADTKAAAGHNHDAAYSPVAHTHTYLPLAGGTLSGFLTLHADPSSAMHAATKQYADTKAASGHNHDAAYSPVAHAHAGVYLPLAGGTMTGALIAHATPTGASPVRQVATWENIDQLWDEAASLWGEFVRYLARQGDSMTGFLTLHADPSSAMHAATKQYVDTKASGSHNHAGVYLPIAGGTMTGSIAMGGFHITGLPATPVAADQAVSKGHADAIAATRVAKAGDTMTGFLTLHADPTATLHAATKQYVDGEVAGAAGIPHVVDPVEPVAPVDGLLWMNPADAGISDEPGFDTPYAKGEIGFHTANPAASQAFTTVVDVTEGAITVTVPTDRILKITTRFQVQVIGTAATLSGIFVGLVTGSGPTYLDSESIHFSGQNETITVRLSGRHVATAGTHTFKLQVQRLVGTDSYQVPGSTARSLLVEDMGRPT